MILGLDTATVRSLQVCLNRQGWGKGVDPKRVAVAEDEDCDVGTQINTINKCVEIILAASKTVGIKLNA